METPSRRSMAQRVRGFFLLCHPGPVLVHIIAVTLFLLLAALPRLSTSVIILAIAAHAAMQVSIAILNDYCDRQADTHSKKSKPIPLGLVSPREALIVGWLMMLLMVVLLLPLNWLALLVSCLYLALGQGYNLGLKSTPLSGIVFALAMPLIPLYAFVAVGRIVPFLFWLVPLGAMLGVTINLANSFPDIEEDAASGAQTLAVKLGVRGTFRACPILIVCAALLIGVLTVGHIVPARSGVILGTLLLVGLAVLGMICFNPMKARKYYFYLVTSTCLVLAGGWLIGVLF